MKTEISAGGVVVRKKGSVWEVLLLKDMKGNWTFPKGIIEKGENPKSAAQREIGEEVGINQLEYISELSSAEYMYYREGLIKKTVHYFLYQSKGDEVLNPQKEEGISQAKWFHFPQALKIIGYAKTNKPLLEEANRHLD
ncbi:NUDIX domain-containing protein [Candidatus Gottesmanbacteria bacterium]|nr:NUDIX domain-containing protein [Candidatus Gottesmanbacteria bacterium]